MFSAFFSQALELIGRSFLIAAFIPTLVVTLGVAMSIDAQYAVDALKGWAETEDFSQQAASALLVLAGIYLAAYVIYGLREALTWLFRTGWLWLAPLGSWRKNRFIQRRRDFDEAKRMSLSVPNATVWALYGFQATEQEDNPYRGMRLSPKTLKKKRKQLPKQLEKLEKNRSRFVALDPLPLVWERKLERLLVDLHLLSFYADGAAREAELQRLIERTKQLDGSDGKRLAAWCRSIQQRTWPDVGDAHSVDYYFPPEKYIQPTALGNVLSWVATYPAERYGMNLDVVYPRLQKCIDAEFAKLIQDRKTFFDFSVIFASLCYAVAMGFLMYGLYGAGSALYLATRTTISPEVFETLNGADTQVLLILGWGFACLLFYMIAVASAKTYGLTLHSGIDLYRLELLKALDLKPPATMKEEKQLWRKMTDSFTRNQVPDIAFDTSAPEPAPDMLISWVQKLKSASIRILRNAIRPGPD